MSRIGIVTDSTCDLGPARATELDVVMVPLKVSFGEETYRDWIDVEPTRFYEMLASASVLPKTSQPSPADFANEYRRLADAGCDGIVSVHLSAAVSGTFESAMLASGMVDVPVRVVDTHSTNVGLVLPLLAAIEARDAGCDIDEIEASARAVVDSTRTLFALDTLEYLVKGGRAGRAQGVAASLLSIKPVLTFDADGVISAYKKVKGTKKAIQEIADAVAEAAVGGRVRLGVLHGEAPELARELLDAIDATGAAYDLVATNTIGAVIGTYAGPRAVGAAFCVVR
ncbi:MAG: DegV family protein [Coriobacteriia bacterium]|nr:DegV family protein [Coriobacteriia bacterium]